MAGQEQRFVGVFLGRIQTNLHNRWSLQYGADECHQLFPPLLQQFLPCHQGECLFVHIWRHRKILIYLKTFSFYLHF